MTLKITPEQIRNKNIKGCVICQNPRISNETDEILINASMSFKSLREHLENRGIYLDYSALKEHAKHIYIETSPVLEEIQRTFEIVKNKPNEALINELLAALDFKLKDLIKNGKDESIEYVKLSKIKLETLMLRAKITGEVKEKIEIIIPDYIRKME